MRKKEEVSVLTLGMKVFHESINSKEAMKIVGIRETQVELEGITDWLPIKGLFRLRKVCEQVEKFGSCQLHNLHCAYPNCEPYIDENI